MKVLYFFLNLISKAGYVRLLAIGIAGYLGYQAFVDIKDASKYKNPQTITMEELEKMPEDKIPKYFILKGAAPSGNYVHYTLETRRKRGGTTRSYYLYYPIYSLDKDKEYNIGDSSRIFIKKSVTAANSELTDEMMDNDYKQIIAQYDKGKIEDGIIKEFSKLKVKVSAAPILLNRDRKPPTSDGQYLWLLIGGVVIVLCLLSYWYEFFVKD